MTIFAYVSIRRFSKSVDSHTSALLLLLQPPYIDGLKSSFESIR
jgi:hypothetical protein